MMIEETSIIDPRIERELRTLYEKLSAEKKLHTNEQLNNCYKTFRNLATTMQVTATSEWSTHTLISSIVPVVQGQSVAYCTRHGHLTEAILRKAHCL
jgi:protein-arginine kinase activator protein McsA